jgi:outer membrane protein X
MKKTFLLIAAAMMTLCASAQQKGDVGIGINLGVAPDVIEYEEFTNFGLGAKINYMATDEVRLEVQGNYWFEDNYLSIFDISANFHYLVPVTNKFALYPLVGLGYGRPKYKLSHWEGADRGESYDRFLFNVGIGGEVALTHDLSLGLEIKYQYMKDFGRIPINLGFTYRF